MLDQHIVSEPIAAGGMASVHLAVPPDPAQPVLAVKRVLPHLASEEFTQMLLDEARVSSAIRHENVVTTYGADVIGKEVFLVMDFVPGLPLHVLQQKIRPALVPMRFAVAIIADVLRGLHAAHEVAAPNGEPMKIVHRDVSPQNILIGFDGVTRILDFGVAKADRRNASTRVGRLKGKLAYMAPEQLREYEVDRRADIYCVAIVLWETLVGDGLFHGANEVLTYGNAMRGCSTPPGKRVAGIPEALDAVVMRALAPHPNDRFATALEMAEALEAVIATTPVRREELAAWLRLSAADAYRRQMQLPAELRGWTPLPPPPLPAPPPLVPPPPPTRVGVPKPAVAARAKRSRGRDWAINMLLFAVGLLWGFTLMRTMLPSAHLVPFAPTTTVVM
jgi:serine/threonine-protein kinase